MRMFFLHEPTLLSLAYVVIFVVLGIAIGHAVTRWITSRKQGMPPVPFKRTLRSLSKGGFLVFDTFKVCIGVKGAKSHVNPAALQAFEHALEVFFQRIRRPDLSFREFMERTLDDYHFGSMRSNRMATWKPCEYLIERNIEPGCVAEFVVDRVKNGILPLPFLLESVQTDEVAAQHFSVLDVSSTMPRWIREQGINAALLNKALYFPPFVDGEELTRFAPLRVRVRNTSGEPRQYRGRITGREMPLDPGYPASRDFGPGAVDDK